jgi:hypothetical protein
MIHAAVPTVGWAEVLRVAGYDDSVTCASCGHKITEHQTGEGAFTGWCCDSDCDCEHPMLQAKEDYDIGDNGAAIP